MNQWTSIAATVAVGLGSHGAPTPAPIARIWLSHASGDISRVSVCWETAEAGDSIVEYGATDELGQRARDDRPTRLHHVDIPAPATAGAWAYRVRSGRAASPVIHAQGLEPDEFRVAIVGNVGFAKSDWASAVLRERPHLLLSAGDNVPSLHGGSAVDGDGLSAFRRLVDGAPELFRAIPFMPALGNHDREIRPRGAKPPPAPVYDVGATAFRKFFALPDKEWCWTLDVPTFGVRFIAPDLNHVQDFGTTWQTCHDFREGSEQLEWYRRTMADSRQPFVITIYNERHATVRQLAGGAWWSDVRRGSAAVTGFGYFAERAMPEGLACINTSVSGRGDPYPDPATAFLANEDNFALLTFSRQGAARIELKGLAAQTLDAFDLDPREAPASRASPGPIQCEGTFPQHLQGICTDGKRSIYWSWTDALVRTDLKGREVRRTPAPSHHGDLCHHDGRVYVAVNLGKFNLPAGHAESWIYVYDAETLAELGRHRVPEVVHGAGGIAHHDGKFIVVGGLPEGTPENYLYEYDDRLVFQRRHTLRSGFTLMGIQTVARAVGSWWFGCYGQPRILLRADDAFRMTGRWKSDAAYGIVGLPDGRLLVGRDEAIKGIGHRGRAVPALPDAARGLVVAGEP